MASSYSTDLKLELMVTGENAGTWGDKTNTNLNLLQQAIAGFESIALTSTNTTLSMTNAAISDARNAVLKFTGTITANCTVFVASGIEKTYILENGTTGNFTVALNQVGGASAIFSGTDKSSKLVYLNGTNVVDLGIVNLQGTQTLTNKTLTSPTLTTPTLTSPIIDVIDDANGNEEIIFTTTTAAVNEFTITNAATGNAPEISATGSDTNIDLKITPKGSGKINLDGIKFPNADGTSGQALTTDGSGNLSFSTISTTFADGSAASPSITFTSDSNTGLFRPGSDRIGFTEGGTQTGEFDASGNFLFNSGYGSVQTAYGCRAWVNFNGTGTVAIRGSAGVSSITDNGTGDYTVNLSITLPDTNYCCITIPGSCAPTSIIGSGFHASNNGTAPTTYSTTAVRILAMGVGAIVDLDVFGLAIFR